MIMPIHTEAVEESGVLDLVWRVFEEFEAPDYSAEGVREFKAFIATEAVKQRMCNNELLLWGYFDDEKIVGMIATRPPCHIALLFVEKEYHRRGIARSLYNTVLAFYNTNTPCPEITVNSSPYATKIYGRLGFVPTNTEQTVNGLRFTPMKHILK